MTFFDCTTDLVGQLNGNGQKGMLQIDAPPVGKFLATPLEERYGVRTRNRVLGAGRHPHTGRSIFGQTTPLPSE